MKKLFLIIFLGFLFFPLISLADGEYKAWKCPTDYVFAGVYQDQGKCCPEDHPFYWPLFYEHANDECCFIISGDDNNECSRIPGANSPIDGNSYTVTYDGLVPCGKKLSVNGGAEFIPCQFCHFFVMFNAILEYISTLVFSIGVLMLVLSGALFIFGPLISPGNPGLVQNAKKIMTAVIIGLAIFFAAYLIVNIFFMVIGVADWVGTWFEIDCPVVFQPLGPELPPQKPPCNTNGCSVEGGKRCARTNHYQICTLDSRNRCLFWGDSLPCPSGQKCTGSTYNAACVADIECPGRPRAECNALEHCYYCGECLPATPLDCSDCNGIQGDCSGIDECHYCTDDDTCRPAGEDCPPSGLQPCPPGTTDNNGLEVVPCGCESHESQRKCYEGGGIQVYAMCQNWSFYDEDCLAWSGSDGSGNLFECDIGEMCAGEDCAASCVPAR